MLDLPEKLTAASFLHNYWQQQPLFMPNALAALRPRISRNELAWLATLDDVESRLIFIERDAHGHNGGDRYRMENGPFAVEELANLPKRDWTLLVHDVEKHLPAMRRLFRHLPFIPDWRIDDLMISFAAPGGGVGPHKDNYDVFLCQGIGARTWQVSEESIAANPAASTDLQLLADFSGPDQCEYDDLECVEGDVLYIPPGVAHWGIAKRACMTYSIGMRAPECDALAATMGVASVSTQDFYSDPDLLESETVAGYISPQSARRVLSMLKLSDGQLTSAAISLGKNATTPKHWLHPDGASKTEASGLLQALAAGHKLDVHAMARIAYDDQNLFVNGQHFAHDASSLTLFREVCSVRRVASRNVNSTTETSILLWMAANGAFDIPAQC